MQQVRGVASMVAVKRGVNLDRPYIYIFVCVYTLFMTQ